MIHKGFSDQLWKRATSNVKTVMAFLTTDSSKLESVDKPLDDPTRPSLSAFAEAGHPFSVHASGEPRGILSGIESSCMTSPKEPWLHPSAGPFDLGPHASKKKRLKITCILLDTRGGSAS
jgi:hypothetical protein